MELRDLMTLTGNEEQDIVQIGIASNHIFNETILCAYERIFFLPTIQLFQTRSLTNWNISFLDLSMRQDNPRYIPYLFEIGVSKTPDIDFCSCKGTSLSKNKADFWKLISYPEMAEKSRKTSWIAFVWSILALQKMILSSIKKRWEIKGQSELKRGSENKAYLSV